MREMDPRVAALVRQYELLLTARHAPQLQGTVSALHGAVCALQRVEQQLLRAQQRSAKAATTTAPMPTLRAAVERALTQLRALAAACPVFLGDTELREFVGTLREYTRATRAALTIAEEATARERKAVAALEEDGVVSAPERACEELEQALVDALPVTRALREKRTHLVELAEAALAVAEGTNSVRTTQLEREKAQQVAQFRSSLEDPSMRTLRQVNFEIQSIEESVRTLLTRHAEISRPITAANARVSKDTEFDQQACEDIHAVVGNLNKLNDSGDAMGSMLEEVGPFLQRLRLFERAASKDAFVVFSTALKLNFSEPLDEELFLAYAADWRDKTRGREALLVSEAYQDASRRITEVKERILRVQTSIQVSRKHVALDTPSKAKLVEQIVDAFHEAGGDTSQILQIIE